MNKVFEAITQASRRTHAQSVSKAVTGQPVSRTIVYPLINAILSFSARLERQLCPTGWVGSNATRARLGGATPDL